MSACDAKNKHWRNTPSIYCVHGLMLGKEAREAIPCQQVADVVY
jgi:hypothetical protein